MGRVPCHFGGVSQECRRSQGQVCQCDWIQQSSWHQWSFQGTGETTKRDGITCGEGSYRYAWLCINSAFHAQRKHNECDQSYSWGHSTPSSWWPTCLRYQQSRASGYLLFLNSNATTFDQSTSATFEAPITSLHCSLTPRGFICWYFSMVQYLCWWKQNKCTIGKTFLYLVIWHIFKYSYQITRVRNPKEHHL